jgi:hypothetical protein
MTVWLSWVVVGALAVTTAMLWWQLLNVGASRRPSKRLLRQPRAGNVYGHWLADRYQLGIRERRKVMEAVFTTGQVPSEPALTEPARGLASEVASGWLPHARLQRWMGWALVVLGAAVSVFGTVGYIASPHDRPVTVAQTIEGVLFAAGYAPALLLTPGQMRRKAQRMLATSSDGASLS